MLSVAGFAQVSCDVEEDNTEFLFGLNMYLAKYQENDETSNNCFVELE